MSGHTCLSYSITVIALPSILNYGDIGPGTSSLSYNAPYIQFNKNGPDSVYNLLGQKVATLVSKKLPAGYHEVELNGQNLSSGVYLYKIVVDSYGEAGEWQDVKRMVLLK